MKVAFYDAKPYDRLWFDSMFAEQGHEGVYHDSRLSSQTLPLAAGCGAVCVFVNDTVDGAVLTGLKEIGIGCILLRCAGYNNVDMKEAYRQKIRIFRVPSYSPAAVAEHAAALLLSVNRKTHKAYARTREFNFSITGLTGMDLYGKTAGVVGTGKIGQMMIRILQGFGMNILAFDLYPNQSLGVEYASLEELMKRSDVITLHCLLTKETRHIINEETIAQMKDGVILVNTSRGALVDTAALLGGLRQGKFGGVGLDVYEEEDEYFFEDWSDKILGDEELALLTTFPNVLLTAHQAFLTKEALKEIAAATLSNLKSFEEDCYTPNEICYQCEKKGFCDREKAREKCF